MRKFTKLMLTLAIMAIGVGSANAKLTLGLPGAWSEGMKDGSTYTFNGSWQGAATWAGAWPNCADWSDAAYEYVWVKYTGYTGNLKMAIEYEEWTSHQDWGDTYAQQSVNFADASGVLFIAIDKTTTFVKGNAEIDGEHIGEIYAKHIRQIVIQDQGAASTLTIEGLYVGTYAEMLLDMGYDVGKNHVLKVTNGTAGSAVWDKSVTYTLPAALTEGKTYTVTAKICAPNVTRGTIIRFVLTGGKEAKYGTDKPILPNTFHEVSQTFKAVNNTGIEMDFGFANGVVYIDDVSFVEDGETTNLVSNGDFEEPLSTAGWSVPGWTGQAINQAEQAIDECTSLLPQKVTIGAAGWATMVAYDFSLSVPDGVNAYYAKYDSEKKNVKLTAVENMPQYGRAVINGEPGDYYFPQITSGVTANWGDNGMEISWGSVKGDGSTIYALGKPAESPVGFYLVKEDETVPSGKPYLPIAGGVSAPEFLAFSFGSETTGIEGVAKSQEPKANGQYFNLNGQRVAQPAKGLYIVNGRKVVLK